MTENASDLGPDDWEPENKSLGEFAGEEYLSTEEVAAMLELSPSALRGYIHQVKRGGRLDRHSGDMREVDRLAKMLPRPAVRVTNPGLLWNRADIEEVREAYLTYPGRRSKPGGKKKS